MTLCHLHYNSFAPYWIDLQLTLIARYFEQLLDVQKSCYTRYSLVTPVGITLGIV